LQYFGEKLDVKPGEFFKTLDAFCSAFDKALKEVTLQEEAKTRKEGAAAKVRGLRTLLPFATWLSILVSICTILSVTSWRVCLLRSSLDLKQQQAEQKAKQDRLRTRMKGRRMSVI
jgi:hypothetical protein